jgi:biopolymer transport protein ExbD
MAAPALASIISMFMMFSDIETPMGLEVRPASACLENGDERIIVLRIDDVGRLFLNTEQENWTRLDSRLSEIYGARANRTLYVSAAEGVPFQTVADVIDIVTNAPIGSADSERITVQLITPSAINTDCVKRRRLTSRSSPEISQ